MNSCIQIRLWSFLGSYSCLQSSELLFSNRAAESRGQDKDELMVSCLGLILKIFVG